MLVFGPMYKEIKEFEPTAAQLIEIKAKLNDYYRCDPEAYADNRNFDKCRDQMLILLDKLSEMTKFKIFAAYKAFVGYLSNASNNSKTLVLGLIKSKLESSLLEIEKNFSRLDAGRFDAKDLENVCLDGASGKFDVAIDAMIGKGNLNYKINSVKSHDIRAFAIEFLNQRNSVTTGNEVHYVFGLFNEVALEYGLKINLTDKSAARHDPRLVADFEKYLKEKYDINVFLDNLIVELDPPKLVFSAEGEDYLKANAEIKRYSEFVGFDLAKAYAAEEVSEVKNDNSEIKEEDYEIKFVIKPKDNFDSVFRTLLVEYLETQQIVANAAVKANEFLYINNGKIFMRKSPVIGNYIDLDDREIEKLLTLQKEIIVNNNIQTIPLIEKQKDRTILINQFSTKHLLDDVINSIAVSKIPNLSFVQILLDRKALQSDLILKLYNLFFHLCIKRGKDRQNKQFSAKNLLLQLVTNIFSNNLPCENSLLRRILRDPMYKDNLSKYLKLTIENNAIEKLEALLNFNKIKIQENYQEYPLLHLAVQFSNQKVFSFLIEKEIFNKNAINELTNAEDLNCLNLAIKNGNVKFIRFLIANYNIDLMKKNKSGDTPLHNAILRDEFKVFELLIKSNIDVNARDNNNQTPFFIATELPGLDYLKLLVENGADPMLCDSNGISAAHSAAENGDWEKIEYLLTINKDFLTIVDKKGRNFIMTAFLNDNFEILTNLNQIGLLDLDSEIDVNNLKLDVDTILKVDHKAGFTKAYNLGQVLALYATEYGDTDQLLELKKLGADLNRSYNGEKLISIAINKKFYEFINHLEQLGIQDQINEYDDVGIHPALILAQHRKIGYIKKLKNLGASLDNPIKNSFLSLMQLGVYAGCMDLIYQHQELNITSQLGDVLNFTTMENPLENTQNDEIKKMIAMYLPNSKDGDTVIHLAIRSLIAENNSLKKLEARILDIFILAGYGDYLIKANKKGETPAFLVASCRKYLNKDFLFKLLEQEKPKVNEITNHKAGYSLYNGQGEHVIFIYDPIKECHRYADKRGKPVDFFESNFNSYFESYFEYYKDLLEVLSKTGIDLKAIKNLKGQTIEQFAIETSNHCLLAACWNIYPTEGLEYSLDMINLQLISKIIRFKNFDLNLLIKKGIDLVSFAIIKYNPSLISYEYNKFLEWLFVHSKLDANFCLPNGKSLAFIAAEAGNLEALKKLQQLGADLSIPCKIMHFANGIDQSLSQLSIFANPDNNQIQQEKIKTPFDIAMELNHTEICNYLMDNIPLYVDDAAANLLNMEFPIFDEEPKNN